jgi:hypothetical protein
MSNFIKAFPLKKKFLHTLAPYSILLKDANCCKECKMEYSAYRILPSHAEMPLPTYASLSQNL